MRILSMNCANCSAPIQIKPEITEFTCAYCGSSQIVDRSGGAVTLNLVTKAIHQVQRGTDRTAAELALVRLRKELFAVKNELDSLGWPRIPKRQRPADWAACAKLTAWSLMSFVGKDPVKYPWYEGGGPIPFSAIFGKDPSKGLDIRETILQWQRYDQGMLHFETNTPRAKQAHQEMIGLETEISINEAIVKRS